MNQIFCNRLKLLPALAVHFVMLIFLLGLSACTTVHAPPSHVVLVDHTGKPLYVNGPDGVFGRLEQTNSDFIGQLAAITNAIATNMDC
ncbi:MAG TPA: hypothetical protein VH251_12360, partial [Verrucomicrobiae bacterium]|nr:hypothetical protein [Verrucomicrobiae bacterium]